MNWTRTEAFDFKPVILLLKVNEKVLKFAVEPFVWSLESECLVMDVKASRCQ